MSKDFKQYYRTFHLNEKLYLHYKGFRKFENMNLFPELKCLYFEGNGLSSMLGLEAQKEMRSLHLHENCIQKMECLEHMDDLRTLSLADNMFSKIEGLSGCKRLITLYAKGNSIGKNGLSDLEGLLECPSLEVIDLQQNHIEEGEILEEILVKMPNLKVLYLFKNPCTKKIKQYRKTIITAIPTLTYLDDRPVFPNDRRTAEAFCAGGFEAEKAERQKI